MPRKEWIAFETLAASEVNSLLMDQSVMTFADSAERASAIPTPTEGMFTYLADVDALDYWNGSVWQSGFASALTLIKTQTIGTAVSSVVVTDAFSSTYDNYKIMINGGTCTQNQNIRLRIGNANTGYYAAGQNITYAAVSTAVGQNNQTLWSFVGYGGANTLSMNADVGNPFNSIRTTYSAPRIGPQVGSDFIMGGGFLDNNNSYTDFTITPAAGTWTGGTIYVYGYRKA